MPSLGYVYFIQSDQAIKIGFATNPDKWIKSLQTSNQHKLVIRLVLQGDREFERILHQRFASARLAGEWFKKCPEIESFICKLTGASGPQNCFICKKCVAKGIYQEQLLKGLDFCYRIGEPDTRLYFCFNCERAASRLFDAKYGRRSWCWNNFPLSNPVL